MKIFHLLAGKANPETLNGVNKVVDALAKEQQKLGLQVSVIGVARNTIPRHQPTYDYHLYKQSLIPFLTPKAAVDFLLQESDEDSIFHFHSVYIPWFYLLIRKLKRHGRNHIIFSPHGAYSTDNMSGLAKKIYFRFIESKIMQEAETVHILDERTERNTYVTKNAKNIVCIPNGVDIHQVPQLTGEYTDTIGTLCRLTCHQKGLDLLIPAFAEYKRRGGRYILKIAGKGNDEALLRKMIHDEGMEDSIFLVGPVFENDKWQFLHDCVAHISPSRYEGIPMSCLESAYMGCVQLTTETTNLGPHVAKYHAGLVIDYPTVPSITQQLLDFDKLTAEEIQAMRSGAHNLVTQELNWNHINKRFVRELYEYQGEL